MRSRFIALFTAALCAIGATGPAQAAAVAALPAATAAVPLAAVLDGFAPKLNASASAAAGGTSSGRRTVTEVRQ